MRVTLENLMLRFSHLSETIFDHLDNQTLVTCKFVSKELNTYLREQKFHKIRIIIETVTKFQELRQPWIHVFKTANTMTIMELGHAVDQFYTKGLKYTNYKGIAPVHVAAGAGAERGRAPGERSARGGRTGSHGREDWVYCWHADGR